jgi:hypothetical protein
MPIVSSHKLAELIDVVSYLPPDRIADVEQRSKMRASKAYVDSLSRDPRWRERIAASLNLMTAAAEDLRGIS